MGRKHLMVFEIEAQIRTVDVARLEGAVAERRNPTLVVSAADDEATTADFTEFFVLYGPVRGANRTDVTRFLGHHNIGFVLDDTTAVTSRTCGCATSSLPCMDDTLRTAAEPIEAATDPEWQTGMDW